MQKINEDSNFGSKFFKFLIVLFILSAILFTILSLVLSENYLIKFSADKNLSESTLQKIHSLRIFLGFFSTILLFFSSIFLYSKRRVINFLQKHKNFFQGLILLIIVFIIFFIIGEIICRSLFYDKTSNFGIGPGTLKFDEKYVALNADGMRDLNYSVQKNGDFRIVVLGDSYTYGFGIKNVSNTYPKLLEADLNNKSNIKYDVLNFGVPGVYIEDELSIYKIKAEKYSPDVVIIGYVLRDLNNVDKNLTFGTSHWYSLPYIGFFLREKSYFYFFLESEFNKIMNIINPSGDYEHSILDAYNSSVNREYNKKIFSELADELKGKKVFVVIFPLVYNWNNYPFAEAHNFIKNISEENNFIVIDLYDYYKNYKASELVVNPDDTHVSELGHRIAAEAIYEKLINEKIIK